MPSGSRHLRRAPVVSGAAQPFCSLEDLAMRTVDFSPLFRSAIGFDRLFDLAEAAQRVGEESYPPYNIERLDENRFQISVALAGFKPDEVDLTVEQNVLTLESRKSDKEERHVPASRHLGAQFQAPVHPCRSRRGQGRQLRERPARHRPAAGDSRGEETAAHRDQRRRPQQRRPDRSQGCLTTD